MGLPPSPVYQPTHAHRRPARSWLVSQRLGNQATTGKIANRTAVVASLQAFLASNYPELVAPIFTAPKGVDALGDPAVGGCPAGAGLGGGGEPAAGGTAGPPAGQRQATGAARGSAWQGVKSRATVGALPAAVSV
jgi:hypothetical protein